MILILFIFNINLIYSILPKDIRNNNNGINSFNNNDYDKALEYFDTLNKYDVKNFNKGTSYYKKQDYDNALSYFLKSLSTKDAKTKLNSLYNMGNTFFKQNKINDALRYYQEALDLCSKNNNDIGQSYCKEMIDKIKNNMEYVFNINEENKNQEEEKQDDKNQDGDNKDKENDTNTDMNKQAANSDDIDKNIDQKNISKDQARQILNIINNNDKEIQKKLLKQDQETPSARGLKNW